jgi:tetratricopeptide (TPR) repeat protein
MAFAEATALDPSLADGWFNLAWVQRAQRRFEEALRSYGEALSAGVAQPEEAHVNRAAILADHLFRTDEARHEFGQALERHPGFVPALAGLAQLHEDEGQASEARACYQQILAAHPGEGRALGRMALLDLADSDPDRVVHGLRQALAGARHAEDRTELLFALASALDAAGQYGEAFRTLTEGNALAERLSGRRYDKAQVERLVDRLIATFDRSPPAHQETSSPIFLCGLFRSGSTLAEQILARHPAVVAGGELEAIPAFAAALQPYPETVPQLSQPQVEQLREAYRNEVARQAHSIGRSTDKRCDNVFHLGLIQTLFPGAAIVHTTRHPLDTLLSTLFLRFGEGISYANRMEDAVHQAVQQERLMQHWRRIMPERIHQLSYDRLVAEPKATLMPLLAFLDLPWHDRLLQAEVDGPVRTASNWQVRRPLHRRSSGRWHRYAQELEPARRIFESSGIKLPD